MTRSDMRTLVIDRIENGIAVLEGEDAMMEVPASWLPGAAREGSALRVEVGREGETSRVTIALDPEAQAAREAEIRELRESVPEGPGGDITL